MKNLLRAVTLLLIPAMVLCSRPVTARAQAATDIDPVAPASGTSSSDDTTEAVLVGLLVVVVAVVFILGFKSDFGRSKRAQRLDLERTYDDMLKAGALPTGGFVAPAFDVAQRSGDE
jgi:hypothetical protein